MIVIMIYWILFTSNACVRAAPRQCDSGHLPAGREGNVGESALFPWLGVLRVHIHQGETFRIALTGIVLVKEGYAIANADDVARIPKRILKEDSKAMFIPRDKEPWFCSVRDYITHPEYEYSTVNTLALIELDPGDGAFPMRPICWPPYSFNTSNQLYAMGYTDDNQLLEKTVYSLQYVEHKLCREFYNRAGLMENKLTPTHYQCGFAKNNKENCVWDNGMVMASNSSKRWTLVGFGIRGPGCSAPARFLDAVPFLAWIDSATNLQEIDDGYRKSANNEGFRKIVRADDVTEISLTPNMGLTQIRYPFDAEAAQDRYFSIDRIDKDAIDIRKIPGEDGNCSTLENKLIYRDETRIVAAQGSGTYKVSLFDLHYMNYSCVKIRLVATEQDTATLFYATKIDHKEGGAFHEVGDTPEEVLKMYPIRPVTPTPDPAVTEDPDNWEPGPHLKPTFLKDKDPVWNEDNVNIYLTFRFEGEGVLNVEVLGPPQPRVTTSSSTEPVARAGYGKDYDDY